MWGKKEAERREKKKNEEYCKKERQEMNEQWNENVQRFFIQCSGGRDVQLP